MNRLIGSWKVSYDGKRKGEKFYAYFLETLGTYPNAFLTKWLVIRINEV